MRFPLVPLVLLVIAPLARTATLPRASEGPESHVTSTQLLPLTSSTAVSLVQNSYPSRVDRKPEPGPEFKVRARAVEVPPPKIRPQPIPEADDEPPAKSNPNNPQRPNYGSMVNDVDEVVQTAADAWDKVTSAMAGFQTLAASSGSGGGDSTSGPQCTASLQTQRGLIAAVVVLAVSLAIALFVLWRRSSTRRSHDGSNLSSPQGSSAAKYTPVSVTLHEDEGSFVGGKSTA